MYWRFSGAAAGCLSLLALTSGDVAAQDSIPLEGIVVTSTKTSEKAIDALSGTSSVGKEQMDVEFQADKASQLLSTVPGVTFSEGVGDTAQSINVRGLMDFGRVNVLIEGARQNFQRTGHNADGAFYIEPEMLKSVDITRGPTSTIYGSGAIGGVVAFSLLDADDILRPGETAAVRSRTRYTSNGHGFLASETAAAAAGNFDILGQFNWRTIGNYTDGSGTEVPDSGSDTDSGMVKTRWRLAPGHQLAATIVDYNSDFVNSTGTTRRDTDVANQQYTLGYTFARPDTPLLDFSAKVYRNDTRLDQTRLTAVCIPGFPPGNCSLADIPAGARRSFDVSTVGTDVSNTSRFAFGAFKLAMTYGGDLFQDEVDNVDPFEGGDTFTPSGERSVYGAFLQSRLTYLDKLELITALRYDNYSLSGAVVTGSGTEDLETDGERVSPKVTLGYTPVPGITLFGTYAEGYRAPAVTETLISGFHPFPGPTFEFLPNPFLRPEVAHNSEVGVNFKHNGILLPADAFRARIVAFRNRVDDFIDPTFQEPNSEFPDGAFKYLNISQATIEGVELEGTYDAGAWFLGVAAHHIRGTNEDTGEGLYSIPADRLTLTAGFRALDDKLLAGARVHFVAAQDRVPAEFSGSAIIEPSDAYNLVDLFGQYTMSDNATLSVNIDNLFDVNYRPYLYQQNNPGLSARVGMTVRFGATPTETAAK